MYVSENVIRLSCTSLGFLETAQYLPLESILLLLLFISFFYILFLTLKKFCVNLYICC